MSENVVYLHAPPPPLVHYLRVGTSGHRQLETLLSAGRVSVDRFIIEAGAMSRQHDLVSALRERRSELILDTNVAELSAKGRYLGAAKAAPWADSTRPLAAADLAPNAQADVLGKIARFAVREGVHAVLAPTHVLGDAADAMFAIDRSSAAALRTALDRNGGQHIGVDYPLIVPYAVFRDRLESDAFAKQLVDVPFDNLWLRISGFGADASPAGIQRYISAAAQYHSLERPIIADGVGGIVALALLAFGAVGGICHGVAEKERFDASGWNDERPGRGSERKVLIEGLDRLLSASQATALMESPSGRRHFACADPSCCARGFDDTLRDAKAHYLHQRQKQVTELSAVPPGRRAIYFLDKQLVPLKSKLQQGARIQVSDETLAEVLRKSRNRAEKMHMVLHALRMVVSGRDRPPPPIRRLGSSGVRAQRRR